MNLEKFMNLKNLNQTETAKLLKVSQKTISNYLNKNSELTESKLCILANYFDVSLDYLCDRKWDNKIGYIPEEKKELINEIISLDKNETEQVEIFIKGLKAGKQGKVDFKIFN
ncbi:MAG: helix-turn-helix transcriptional regulator [Clostridia bacterium]|nr:helix-turn-helix transcriptional regulator [Clostridia bacterium]